MRLAEVIGRPYPVIELLDLDGGADEEVLKEVVKSLKAVIWFDGEDVEKIIDRYLVSDQFNGLIEKLKVTPKYLKLIDDGYRVMYSSSVGSMLTYYTDLYFYMPEKYLIGRLMHVKPFSTASRTEDTYIEAVIAWNGSLQHQARVLDIAYNEPLKPTLPTSPDDISLRKMGFDMVQQR